MDHNQIEKPQGHDKSTIETSQTCSMSMIIYFLVLLGYLNYRKVWLLPSTYALRMLANYLLLL